MSIKTQATIPLIRNRQNVKAFFYQVLQTEFEHLKSNASQFLSEEELFYFKKLEFEKRQRSYLLGRFAAKQVCYQFFNESDLKEIVIKRGIFDQPFVSYPVKEIPEISIAHNDAAAVAIASESGHPMGIDLETFHPDRMNAVLSQLSQFEKSWIQNQNLAPEKLAYMLWSVKEALSKILRCGLTTPFEILEIKDPQIQNQILNCYFKNFAQYQGVIKINQNNILSIVLPKKTNLDPTWFLKLN